MFKVTRENVSKDKILRIKYKPRKTQNFIPHESLYPHNMSACMYVYASMLLPILSCSWQGYQAALAHPWDGQWKARSSHTHALMLASTAHTWTCLPQWGWLPWQWSGGVPARSTSKSQPLCSSLDLIEDSWNICNSYSTITKFTFQLLYTQLHMNVL